MNSFEDDSPLRAMCRTYNTIAPDRETALGREILALRSLSVDTEPGYCPEKGNAAASDDDDDNHAGLCHACIQAVARKKRTTLMEMHRGYSMVLC